MTDIHMLAALEARDAEIARLIERVREARAAAIEEAARFVEENMQAPAGVTWGKFIRALAAKPGSDPNRLAG